MKDLESNMLQRFLESNCPHPQTMREALGTIEQLKSLKEDEALCGIGDRAECYWIIESGELEIRSGNRLLRRYPGEMIGEQAFYRPITEQHPFPFRGAEIVAVCPTTVWTIDHSKINQLSPEMHSLWNETVARVLSSKLDQATRQRVEFLRDIARRETLIRRFVSEPGRESAAAALASGSESVKPQRIKSVIWFSDIVGFSKFAKAMDGADVAKVIRSLMDIQAEEIGSREGHIDKFMGDGLMAFWICPDEERACRFAESAIAAALATADRIIKFAAARSVPVDIRVGLHFGDVIMGDFGGSDRIAFSLIGDAVNDASRYEQAKDGKDGDLGRIRVSESLFDIIKSRELRSQFRERPTVFTDKHGFEFKAYILTKDRVGAK